MATEGAGWFGLPIGAPPPQTGTATYREALAAALLRGLPPPTPTEQLQNAAIVAATTLGTAPAAKLLRKLAARLERRDRQRRPLGRRPVDDRRWLAAARVVLEARPDVTPAVVAAEVAALAQQRGEPMQSPKAYAERIRRKLVLGITT